MIILIGPSASGKTEVVKYLVNNYGYTKLVTNTTREKRIGEIDGKDYNFITREDFLSKLKNNEFFEYVEYNSNFYGTLKKDITKEKVVILEPKGYQAYRNSSFEGIVSFYLDTRDDIRFERMLKRGDKEEKIKERIDSDGIVFSRESIDGVDYILNSNDLTVPELAIEIDKLYRQALKK